MYKLGGGYHFSTRCSAASGRLWPSPTLSSQALIYLRHNTCNPLVCEELIHNTCVLYIQKGMATAAVAFPVPLPTVLTISSVCRMSTDSPLLFYEWFV
jgi:hypothetical protein